MKKKKLLCNEQKKTIETQHWNGLFFMLTEGVPFTVVKLLSNIIFCRFLSTRINFNCANKNEFMINSNAIDSRTFK